MCQDNRQGPEPLSILFLLLPLLYVEEEEGINVARAQRDGGGEISRLNSEVWGGGAWWSAIYAGVSGKMIAGDVTPQLYQCVSLKQWTRLMVLFINSCVRCDGLTKRFLKHR